MPQLHARMNRLPPSHKKLPMLPEHEPNFFNSGMDDSRLPHEDQVTNNQQERP